MITTRWGEVPRAQHRAVVPFRRAALGPPAVAVEFRLQPYRPFRRRQPRGLQGDVSRRRDAPLPGSQHGVPRRRRRLGLPLVRRPLIRLPHWKAPARSSSSVSAKMRPGPAPPGKSGSHMTRRWRKQDSNPRSPPKAVSLAPVLAEPDADPVAVAPDGIEQQREVTTKEVC